LSYQDALAPTAAGAPPGAGAPLPSAESLEELSIKPRYHLTGERQVRSGELHYFDHPAFGVLIKITPVRPDPNASGAPGSRPAA